MRVDLNSDLGEGFGPWRMGDDEAMLGLVSSANIACGAHAGDPDIMFRTAASAKAKGVAIGAHPGFADLAGFGRRRIAGLSAGEIERLVAWQIGALQGVAALAGHTVTHVKPHGALSNMANEEPDLALAIGRAVKSVDRTLIYVVMPGRPTEAAARALDLPLAREVFADRAYDGRGNLVARHLPGAVIRDPDVAAARVLRMLEDRSISADDGVRLPIEIETVCVHGDTPEAAAMARAIRAGLLAAGVEVKAFAHS